MSEVSQTSLKILHIPCNTPYVRKIKKIGEIEIVNGTRLLSGESVPFEITYRWIFEHQNDKSFLALFDICHLHYGFEFESIEVVEAALKLLRQCYKPVVYTCHELSSAHGVPTEQYRKYLTLIFKYTAAVITLTDEAKIALMVEYPQVSTVTVIPHGYVWFPHVIKEGVRVQSEILFFGAIRPNRDIPTTFINVLLGTDKYHCRVSWVTHPFTQDQLENLATLRVALELVARNPLMHVELTLPLTNEEVVARVSEADILVLPYTSAGHSGQLELAYDCGVLPVATNVGFLFAQQQLWPKENDDVPKTKMVDWVDGKSWMYQARLLQGVREALKILPSFKQSLNWDGRRSFRAKEYERFLDDHFAVYRKSILGKEWT